MQLPMCHLLVKSHLWNQYGEKKDWKTSQCGGFIFQNMPGELFISECSSIKIVPRCWGLLHHNDMGMPPPSRKSSQSNSSLGEGTAEKRGGGTNKREPDYPRSRLIHEPKEGNPSPVGSNRNLCTRHSPVKAAPTHVGSLLPLSLVF